jgi:hypothetical protein
MILAPTLSILSSGSGAIVRPTFSRDFAGEKTLNNGTGPAITFTRGSQATYFTADGTLRFAPHNAARNSEAVGATNGVIWSPSAFVGAGSIPQWASFRTFGSMEVVGSGTELGMRYVDVKISGTNADPVNAGAQIIAFNAFDNCVASSGQTWTSSASIRLVGGSLTNVSLVYLAMQGRQADTTSTEVGATTFTPSSTYQRVVATKAMTNASTARVSPDLTVVVAPSSTVDLTLRIAAPQLERNATASDYIPTTGTANFDQPRFDHDPATGASRGLLIEEARTNLLERSAEFDNAYWTKFRSSVTANSTTAPDGTASADTLVEDTSTNTHNVYRPITHSGAASTVTYSMFAKQKERPRVQFDLIAIVGSDSTGVRCTFNLSNGTAGSVFGTQTGTGSAGTGTASITNVGNGWYRCSLTLVPTAGITPTSNQIYVSTDNGTTSNYTGDNTSGLYIWGAQLEAGAFLTSYIPTTSAAVTRSADSAIVTPISSFYNASEGTLFAEASRYQTTSNSKFLTFVRGSDVLFNVVLETNATAPTTSQRISVTDSTAQAAIGVAGAVAGTIYKMAGVYKTDDFQFAQDGTLGTADTSGTVPTGITRMGVGTLTSDTTNQFFLNGYIRKIAYYPKRLSNALLEQLTT